MLTDSVEPQTVNKASEPQCQFFVVRKKRLCRMTVRPGRQYCGEHEPQPLTSNGQEDKRIPCPNDPKHTCYISKLEKHLSICNARQTEQPPYIVHNINVPTDTDEQCVRKPLSQIPKEVVLQVIEKVNYLYEKHIKDNVTAVPEHPIHSSVLEEFNEEDRTESSLRHLRQVSSLLWLAEDEGLVGKDTCYVELGAGKGQLSYYVCKSWCSTAGSGALLVDRASLRHKRDNKLTGVAVNRVRADLAHLDLGKVPMVEEAKHIVGFAKHLCGVATDLALRCVTAGAVSQKAGGAVLATCCHHRCERAPYVANRQMEELNVSGDELNVMFAIVSWATCGDGRSRDRRDKPTDNADNDQPSAHEDSGKINDSNGKINDDNESNRKVNDNNDSNGKVNDDKNCYNKVNDDNGSNGKVNDNNGKVNDEKNSSNGKVNDDNDSNGKVNNHNDDNGKLPLTDGMNTNVEGNERLVLTQEYRERVGRRAKLLLDWGRVLYLREHGFDARLCHYVPTHVSLENVCIVAKKS